jgi:hypothetical protein
MGTSPQGGISLERDRVPTKCLATNDGQADMIFEFNYTAQKKRIRRLAEEVEAGETALFSFSDAVRSFQNTDISPGQSERERQEIEAERNPPEDGGDQANTSLKIRHDKVLVETKF